MSFCSSVESAKNIIDAKTQQGLGTRILHSLDDVQAIQRALEFIADLMENFEPLKTVATVGTVWKKVKDESDPQKRYKTLHEEMLAGLADIPTGLYSKFHENTVWQLGYDHPVTIRNAFM